MLPQNEKENQHKQQLNFRVKPDDVFKFLLTVLYEHTPKFSLSLFFVTVVLNLCIRTYLEISNLQTLITLIQKFAQLKEQNNVLISIINLININLLLLVSTQLKNKQLSLLLNSFNSSLRKSLEKMLLRKDYEFFINNDKTKVLDQYDSLYTGTRELLEESLNLFELIISIFLSFSSFIIRFGFLSEGPQTRHKVLNTYIITYVTALLFAVICLTIYITFKIKKLAFAKHRHGAMLDIFVYDQMNNINIIHSFGSFAFEEKIAGGKINNYYSKTINFERCKSVSTSIFEVASYLIYLLDYQIIIYFLKFGLIADEIGWLQNTRLSIRNLHDIFHDVNYIYAGVKNFLEIYENIKFSLLFFEYSRYLQRDKNFDYCSDNCTKLLNETVDSEDSFKLSLSNLDFRYYKRESNLIINALEDINLEFYPGDKVGIVGRSGCGKTSLINNILGLYRSYNGQIEFGPYIQKHVKQCCWSKLFSFIPQNPRLFNRTILSNLLLDNNYATFSDITKVCELCNCGFIYENDKSFNFLAGVGGEKLSGGQQQRIAIARALLRKRAKCLIMDEGTSALDIFSEKLISQNIISYFNEKIIISIAHRLQTLKYCNKIVMLENGKVVALDTPTDLYKHNPTFKLMCEEQNCYFK